MRRQVMKFALKTTLEANETSWCVIDWKCNETSFENAQRPNENQIENVPTN